MKKILALLLVLVLMLTACSGGTQPVDKPNSAGNADKQEDGLIYNDKQEYSSVYSNEVTTLNYLTTATTIEYALAANFIDTLVEYDRYGVLKPCLATEWSVSDDGLVWTFKLREGVKWVNHDGEEYAEMTAQDFVDAMKYILNKDNASATANVAYKVLKNGEAYYNEEITDFNKVGIKAADKYTLEYTLEKPTPYFESMLTYVCFFPVNGAYLEEVGDRFGTSQDTLLYNGAYLLETFEPQNKRVLAKNENYWDKDNVHIEKINYKYNKESTAISTELYQRGETSSVDIPNTSIDVWMNDPELKAQIRPVRPTFFTYFYCFNFDPHLDEEYEPENWKTVVNNTNFRKSLFHALNRTSAMMTVEPYDPQKKMLNTITPKGFVAMDGKDFTEMSDLDELTNSEYFNQKTALQYKAKALEELEGKATFPVKVLMPYNTSYTDWTQRAQVIEQSMEKVLGQDYIDIILLPHPPTGFLNDTRRAGNYALMECNWGPDYADPETYTDPFKEGGSYNFPEFCEEVDENGQNLYKVYEAMVEDAKSEVIDIHKRYEIFAKAEAYLIDKGFVLPYGVAVLGGGYKASLINPFEEPYSPFGVSSDRWKGQHILAKPLNTEQYYELQEQWEIERQKALQEAEQK